jgi:hypothetical protein
VSAWQVEGLEPRVVDGGAFARGRFRSWARRIFGRVAGERGVALSDWVGARPLWSVALIVVTLVGSAALPWSDDGEVVLERYASGAPMREVHYRDGQLDGVVRGWFENGALEYERRYVDGREHGTHRGWFADGSPRFVYHFARGASEGMQQQWYPSGQLFARFHYAAGHEQGQQQLWNPDGTIRSNYVIKDGKRYGLVGAVGCTGVGMSDDPASGDAVGPRSASDIVGTAASREASEGGHR